MLKINNKKIRNFSFLYIFLLFLMSNQSLADVIWEFKTNKSLQNKFLKKHSFNNNIKKINNKNNKFLSLQPILDKNFEITDISINKSYEHNIIKGPKNFKTNKLIISSLRGNTSISGKGETFNIGITYNNKPYTIEIGDIELSGYLNGNFKGMPAAPFDNLELQTSIKVQKQLISLGKKWHTHLRMS